jgi:hypothetical protein
VARWRKARGDETEFLGDLLKISDLSVFGLFGKDVSLLGKGFSEEGWHV